MHKENQHGSLAVYFREICSLGRKSYKHLDVQKWTKDDINASELDLKSTFPFPLHSPTSFFHLLSRENDLDLLVIPMEIIMKLNVILHLLYK